MTRKLYGTPLTDYSLADLKRMEWIFSGDVAGNRARLDNPRRETVDSIAASEKALAEAEPILADIRSEIASRREAA